MKALPWIVVVVVVVVAGVLAFMWRGASTELDLAVQAHSATVQTLEERIEQKAQNLEQHAQELEAKVAELAQREGIITSLRTELQDIQETIDTRVDTAVADTREAMVQLREEIEEHEKHVSSLNTQITDLKNELDNKDQTIASLRTAAERRQQEMTALQEQVEEKTTTAEALTRRLLEHGISVEPEKKFVGTVLVTHRDPEFYIIDLGAADSVPVGTELSVSRDARYIGKIQIKSLIQDEDKLSWGTVVSLADEKTPIQEGDVVRN